MTDSYHLLVQFFARGVSHLARSHTSVGSGQKKDASSDAHGLWLPRSLSRKAPTNVAARGT